MEGELTRVHILSTMSPFHVLVCAVVNQLRRGEDGVTLLVDSSIPGGNESIELPGVWSAEMPKFLQSSLHPASVAV